MDLQTKPVKAAGFEHDGTLTKAIELMSWVQSQGYQLTSQALSLNQQTGSWIVAITYFKPKPEGTTPSYLSINLTKGIIVVTSGVNEIKQYATKEALSADFDVVESA